VKVAVTGGAGFIGGWTCDELVAAGHDVVVYDPRGRASWDAVERRMGDVRDRTAVLELAAHVDAIIHLSAVLGTQETIADPYPAAETNLLGTLNVLHAAKRYDLPMVNIAVGNWWMNNPYSISKNCAERFVEMYRDENGLQAANVRCVNAYGPRQAAAPPFGSGKVRKIMPAFVCRALTGMPVEVYGDGQQVSDCVWVGDVARTLVATLEACATGRTPTRTIEVGPTDSTTVLDIARMVVESAARHTGHVAEIKHLPMRPGEKVGTPVTCDSSTLSDVASPWPLVHITEGIRRTVDWFHDNKGRTWHPPA
jgi:UDP-glucose 4-epimerase